MCELHQVACGSFFLASLEAIGFLPRVVGGRPVEFVLCAETTLVVGVFCVNREDL